MARLLTSCGVVFFCAFASAASAQIKTTDLRVNTIGTPEILIVAEVEFDSTFIIDAPELISKSYSFKIKSAIDGKEIDGSARYEKVTAQARRLLFRLRNVKKEMVDLLMSGKEPYFVWIDNALHVRIYKPDSEEADTLIITSEHLSQSTSSIVKLTEKQAQSLIDAAGGEIHIYNNLIELGKKASISDSSKEAYVVSFAIAQPFLASGNVFYAKGKIGTDEKDPLNKIAIYPVTLDKSFEMPAFGYPSDIAAQIGVEASQDFSLSRLNINFYVQSIIPNLVDFTFGENRLRLKPILKFGAKGLFEIEDRKLDNVKTNNFEMFSELYYYVPVMKNYSIIIHGNAYWIDDNSKKVRKELDVTLGVEIPNSGLKAMAMYSVGESDVGFVKDSRLLLGLLLDIFEKK